MIAQKMVGMHPSKLIHPLAWRNILLASHIAAPFLLASSACTPLVPEGGEDVDDAAEDGTSQEQSGSDDDENDQDDDASDSEDGNDQDLAIARGPTGIVRLSRSEYRATIRALLGIDVAEFADFGNTLDDNLTPLDNDYRRQALQNFVGQPIDAYQALAEAVAANLVADSSLLEKIIPCEPDAAVDAKCFHEFVERFGRSAWRRPLRPQEIERYNAFLDFAAEANDFKLAVAMAVRSMLQDLNFFYRVEIGEPIAGQAGTFALNDWEIATRLSYTLWGENPDEALLDDAQKGRLRDDATFEKIVDRMLTDPRAAKQAARFHALIWNYERPLSGGDLAPAFRRETDALIERISFDPKGKYSWLDLFSFPETFVNDELRDNYGLPAKSGADFEWVKYSGANDDSQRKGILSHGAILSNGAQGNDTSPTFRGKFVITRLLCQSLPAPDEVPPLDPGDGSDCKIQRYQQHGSDPACSGCHERLDGFGFGLERFDQLGRFRTSEPGRPHCQIDGEGSIPGQSEFNGPGELGELIVERGDEAPNCMVSWFYKYAIGRSDDVSKSKNPKEWKNVQALQQHFRRSNYDFRQLVTEWVMSEGFKTRTVDETI
jgi:hypothetical protein